VSSSDELKDPFSEDTGGGLLETEGGENIQDAKSAKVGGWKISDHGFTDGEFVISDFRF
jgi:hypothetical protein